MSLYFLDGGGMPPSLDPALRSWLSGHLSWHLRQVPTGAVDMSSLAWLFPPPAEYRRAEAREVAEALLADPNVEAALRALGSPAAQHIETAVASQYMPPADAQLLTEGLHLALRYVTNQSNPLWKRADVLIGVGAAVALVIVLIVVARHRGGGTPPVA